THKSEKPVLASSSQQLPRSDAWSLDQGWLRRITRTVIALGSTVLPRFGRPPWSMPSSIKKSYISDAYFLRQFLLVGACPLAPILEDCDSFAILF
ncbi:hypothetical protein, partial [Pseudomonas aeruginosa]|uniref:hypothetical protein n=1 Tax=Pseudomonas aeruginosa TaxID=287 RepID=UPI003CEAE16E